MNQIQITIPNELQDNIDIIIYLLQKELRIKNITVMKGDNNSIIIIRRKKKASTTNVMEKLTEIGVGVDFGIIDILPISASVPDIAVTEGNEERDDDKSRKFIERVSLEEINNIISELGSKDVDYLIYITLASILSAAGLILNSSTIIIASMILSPLMGPILAMSYGILTKNKNFIKNGLRGQILGAIIGIGIGCLMGLYVRFFWENFAPTHEMLIRKYPGVFDIIIAVSGGIAVGFSITGGVRMNFVGIAVAVALLPPAVNSGIALMLQNYDLFFGSLVLFLTNVFAINICAFMVFKIKRIRSIPTTPKDWVGPREEIKSIETLKTEERRQLLEKLKEIEKKEKEINRELKEMSENSEN